MEAPVWQDLREALGFGRKLRVLSSFTSPQKIWMLLSACTSGSCTSAVRCVHVAANPELAQAGSVLLIAEPEVALEKARGARANRLALSVCDEIYLLVAGFRSYPGRVSQGVAVLYFGALS